VAVGGNLLKIKQVTDFRAVRALCAIFAINYEGFAQFMRKFETEYRLSVAKTQFRREINSLGMESG